MGKENIEGYACLLNVFLSSLVSSNNPGLINVDNEDLVSANNDSNKQIFYSSTLKFQDSFTLLMSKQLPQLKSINVKVNFDSLKNNRQKQMKLCN